MVKQERELRVGVLGCGFWAAFQVAGWLELPGVRIAALYNRTRSKAEALAERFGVQAVYDDAGELLRREGGRIDVVDIITSMETHAALVQLAAEHRVPVICQKPMAPALEQAKGMVAACREAGVPLLIHENWRWQTPIRQLKRVVDSGAIGTPFRGRIDFATGFPVFDNQPFLRGLEQFILTDMGSHLLDTARFFFGEAQSLYCRTAKVHKDIRGEDVATVMMSMGEAATHVTCGMSYAGNAYEHDRFPETYVFVEGDRGSVSLGPDYWVRTTTVEGTHARRYPPPRYSWVDPAYEVVQSSIVACNADLAAALRGTGRAETTGEDNLQTMRLVFAAYESARRDQVIDPGRM